MGMQDGVLEMWEREGWTGNMDGLFVGEEASDLRWCTSRTVAGPSFALIPSAGKGASTAKNLTETTFILVVDAVIGDHCYCRCYLSLIRLSGSGIKCLYCSFQTPVRHNQAVSSLPKNRQASTFTLHSAKKPRVSSPKRPSSLHLIDSVPNAS